MVEMQYFYGLHPRWFQWDQLFRIYVTPDRLCGAYIAGQIQDEKTAALQLQSLRFLAQAYIRRVVKQRADRESLYDRIDPSGEAFLETDKRNFHILRTEICKCTISDKPRLWTPKNTGTVTLIMRSGTQKQFILVGQQDPQALAELLKSFDPTLKK